MKVLTLSQAYEPLGVIDWNKAINLYFLGKVHVLSEYEKEIHSPSITMKIPSVIVFRGGRHKKVNSVRFSRKNVWIRDEGRCQYCNTPVSIKNFTLDHVHPRTLGGKSSWTNVVTCCVPCNQRKADRTLARSGLKLLKQPIKPNSLPYVQDVEHFYGFQAYIPEDWKFWLGEDYNK